MKKLSLLRSWLPVMAASLLFSCASTKAIDLLPTFNDAYYKDGKFVEKHLGKMVAVEGILKEVKPGPDKKPILLITLSGDSKKELWVASLPNITLEMVPLGSLVRVLGYFDETVKETKFMTKLTKDREYLLGFCFNNMDSGMPSYLTAWLKQCIDWETGENAKDISR
ncbi:MAG: hypothetical protein ACI8WB_003271 [Phenylobacterium sp.]|jgi:hypothetical protein